MSQNQRRKANMTWQQFYLRKLNASIAEQAKKKRVMKQINNERKARGDDNV